MDLDDFTNSNANALMTQEEESTPNQESLDIAVNNSMISAPTEESKQPPAAAKAPVKAAPPASAELRFTNQDLEEVGDI